MITEAKKEAMLKLSNENGIIAALAIDQRGALTKMLHKYKSTVKNSDLIQFKKLVSSELTKYSSAILLDPEYGLEAAKIKDSNCGLLLAYEKTGYDANKKGRLPDLLNIWSVKRLKDSGADAIKFLLYYDIDEEQDINNQKQAFIERIGSECQAEDIPFYLEIVSYDANNLDKKELAKLKPHKVNNSMFEFSKSKYNVDVLKVEVPVDMNYVENYNNDNEIIYSKAEAIKYFKEQSEATNLPFIFLSAGVSSSLFLDTLKFAKESQSTFNGILCGRATWTDAIEPFVNKGETEVINWFRNQGRNKIGELNKILNENASSWFEKYK